MSNCFLCNSKLNEFKLFDGIPQSSAKLYKTATLNLNSASFNAGICNNCYHVVNLDHNKNSIYETYTDDNYITKKSVSTSMSQNLKTIVDYIIKNIPSSCCNILEIGSGSGEISNYFSELNYNITTVDPCIKNYKNLKIKHYSEFFDQNLISKFDKKFDFVIARHIIEHTDNPKDFINLCKEILQDSGIIYLEVPNLENTIEERRVVDFFNDHIHHFSINSLKLLASLTGIEYIDHLLFLNNAHIGIIFKNKKTNLKLVLEESKNNLNFLIDKLSKSNKIAIYGAGAHSSTFISLLPIKIQKKIVMVLDRDQNKTNQYLPDSPVSIQEPTDLTNFDGTVVNTSTLYKEEIEQYIKSNLNFKGQLLHI